MADRVVTYELRASIGTFKAQLAQASASVRHTADEMTAASKKGATFRQGLTTLGSTAGKVGLIAAAGLGAAVLSAANFDEAMAHVRAATHESAANMTLLRDAALEAGARTVFSATEAANAVEELAKAGVSTKDILGGGLNAALDLASAGTLDVAQAAEIAATTMNQFDLAGSDAGRAADVLAAAAGRAQGEVTDIAEAMKYIGPVANQMGVSLEEAGGAVAYLATQGIQGEQAGTGLRGMLLSLTSPSKQASDELKKLGINMYDAQGHFVGLDGVAGQLHQTMSGLSEADRDEALGRIFGNAQVTTARILYAGGAKAVKDWTNAVDDSGYASETAAIKMDSLKGDLEKLGGALQTALISSGSGSQGPLRSVTQHLTDVVDAFNKVPPAAQGAATSFLGITAITGGGFWLGAKVITGISDTRQALEQLGPAGTKAAGALKGVVGAAAGLLALNAASDAVNAMFRSLDDAAPSVDRLTRNLENLGGDKSRFTALSLRAIGEEVGNLGDLLDTTDSRFAGSLKQTTVWLDRIPLVGDTAANQIENLDSVTTKSLQSWREADATVQALDSSLMQIASTAGPGGAQKVFDDLARSQGLTADQQAKLMALLPEFGDLMRDTGRAGEKAGAGTTFFGHAAGRVLGVVGAVGDAADKAAKGIKGVGEKAGPSAARLKTLQDALEKDRQAASDTAGEFFNLGNKLDKAKVSLSDWLRNLEKQAQALRDFRLNAERAAKRGLDDGLIASLEEAGTAGALRMRQLANATDAEIGRANKAWRAGQREIDKYVDSTVKVPKALATNFTTPGLSEADRDVNATIADLRILDSIKASPTVYIGGVAQSIADLNALQARVDSLHGKTITNTVRTLGGPAAGGMAAGGTVPGLRHPYGDKTYIFAAPGEEVISNRFGEADRFRADRAAGRIPAYAGGGTVGMQRIQSSSRQHVEFAPARVDIRLPNGDIQSVELIARAAARSEMSADRRWQNGLDDRD